MKRIIDAHIILLPATLLALVSSAWLYAKTVQPRLHPPDTPCASCHFGGDTMPLNISVLVASQEQLCGRCHPDSLQLSHPSGFVPPDGQIVPAAYPLDGKGKITCSTCHEVHGNSHWKLRGTARGWDMCLACHDQAFFDSMPDGGASLVQYGNLGAPDAQNWQNLDQYSIQCLECHSDSGDKNDGEDSIVLASNQILRHGSLNHSIGRRYADAIPFGGYRAINKLSKKIRLPNGMVSCISCHEGYSKNHGKLITAITGSALCFECHDL